MPFQRLIVIPLVLVALGGCATDPISLIPPTELALIERDMAVVDDRRKVPRLSIEEMLAAARGDTPPAEKPEASKQLNGEDGDVPTTRQEPIRPLSVEELLARVREIDESQREGETTP